MLCIACSRYITKYSFNYFYFVSAFSKGGLALLTRLSRNLTEDSFLFTKGILFHVAPFSGFCLAMFTDKVIFVFTIHLLVPTHTLK